MDYGQIVIYLQSSMMWRILNVKPLSHYPTPRSSSQVQSEAATGQGSKQMRRRMSAKMATNKCKRPKSSKQNCLSQCLCVLAIFSDSWKRLGQCNQSQLQQERRQSAGPAATSVAAVSSRSPSPWRPATCQSQRSSTSCSDVAKHSCATVSHKKREDGGKNEEWLSQKLSMCSDCCATAT